MVCASNWLFIGCAFNANLTGPILPMITTIRAKIQLEKMCILGSTCSKSLPFTGILEGPVHHQFTGSWHPRPPLYSLLGRLPKAKDPKKDFNACSDALFIIVAAACDMLEILFFHYI